MDTGAPVGSQTTPSNGATSRSLRRRTCAISSVASWWAIRAFAAWSWASAPSRRLRSWSTTSADTTPDLTRPLFRSSSRTTLSYMACDSFTSATTVSRSRRAMSRAAFASTSSSSTRTSPVFTASPGRRWTAAILPAFSMLRKASWRDRTVPARELVTVSSTSPFSAATTLTAIGGGRRIVARRTSGIPTRTASTASHFSQGFMRRRPGNRRTGTRCPSTPRPKATPRSVRPSSGRRRSC